MEWAKKGEPVTSIKKFRYRVIHGVKRKVIAWKRNGKIHVEVVDDRRKSPTISMEEAREIHGKRRSRGRRTDESRTNKKVLKKPTRSWANRPGRYDVKGIDTSSGKKKTIPAKKYGLHMYGSYRIYSAFVEYRIMTEDERKKRNYVRRFAIIVEYIRKVDKDSNIENTLERDIFSFETHKGRKTYDTTGNGVIISLPKREFFKILNNFEDNVKKLQKSLEEREKRERIKKEREEKARIEELIEKAKRTGKAQLIEQYSIPCQDQREECDVDLVQIFIDGNGKKTKRVIHTW